MASLTISWSLCDGRLTAKWNEEPNAQPFTSVLREPADVANAASSRYHDGGFAVDWGGAHSLPFSYLQNLKQKVGAYAG